MKRAIPIFVVLVTALSVLPAHRLLLKGEGHYAVVLSVTDNLNAVHTDSTLDPI